MNMQKFSENKVKYTCRSQKRINKNKFLLTTSIAQIKLQKIVIVGEYYIENSFYNLIFEF